MKDKKPVLVLLAGPSGVGKDTVLARLKKRGPQRHFPVTVTTRKRRPREVHGKEYFFLDRNQFQKAADQEEFLEYCEVHGQLYGTPKLQVLPQMEEGRDVILKVDVQGAAKIKIEIPQAVRIFIAPESMSQLEGRLRKRPGMTPDELETRMLGARREIQEGNASFENQVVNREGCVAATVLDVERIIAREKEA